MFFDHEEGGAVEQQQPRKNQAIMLQTFSPFRLKLIPKSNRLKALIPLHHQQWIDSPQPQPHPLFSPNRAESSDTEMKSNNKDKDKQNQQSSDEQTAPSNTILLQERKQKPLVLVQRR